MQASSDRARALIDTGLQQHRQGNLAAARDTYTAVLALAPDHPDALNLMGTVLLQLDEAGAAVGYLERAARAQRNHPGVQGNLAQAYFAVGRYADAESAFRKAARLEPREPGFQAGIANALALQGRLAEAESLLTRLVARAPDNPLVWFNLGNVVRDLGRPADAVECYRRTLALDPGHVDARNNLGGALQKLYRFDEAEREYRACMAAAPDYPVPRLNLASVLIDVGRFSDAEALLRDVVAATPDIADAHTYLGAALGHQGRLREALEHHRAAALLTPDNPQTAETYMSALLESGDFDEGLRWLERARKLAPGSSTAPQRAYSALLAHGRFAEGWAAYSDRPASVRLQQKFADLKLAQTLPADLHGKRIAVLREQGLGDEIFFLRYAPLLVSAGAAIVYRASNKIASLLERAGCLAQVLPEEAPVPAADLVMLAGDIPGAWYQRESATASAAAHGSGQAFEARPAPSLLIPPRESSTRAMRERLAAAGQPPYIGVTWKGGTAPEEQRGGPAWVLHKEIGIADLARVLHGLPATVIALQRKPAVGEIDEFSRQLGTTVHDFTDLNETLEDMLALLALIDDYVGVSNTNMHLRAAAGRTARVVVPQPAEWRWMAQGGSSPWFPGFSVYRQTTDGEWAAPLAALARDLTARFGTGR